mgnify:FL=1
MKIKEMLNVIIDKGNVKDMYKLNEMLNDLICDLKEQNPRLYKEYKKELYEVAYGNVILEDKAKEIVQNMKPYKEHFTMENAKEIKDDYSIKHSISDVYLVVNSLYNDYHEILDENNDMYAKMTKLWLNDADSVDDKVYEYFCTIPKED